MKNLNDINLELMTIMDEEILILENTVKKLENEKKTLIELIIKKLPQYDEWLKINFEGEK